MGERTRTVVGGLLFGVGAMLVAMAAVAVSRTWAAYQDSPDSLYIEAAAIALLFSLPFFVGAHLALRR